jgi:hypothetical protein
MHEQKIAWFRLSVRQFGSIVLALCLTCGSTALAQNTTPASDQASLQRLFTAVNALMVQVKSVCKSEECSLLAEGGAQINDAANSNLPKGYSPMKNERSSSRI